MDLFFHRPFSGDTGWAQGVQHVKTPRGVPLHHFHEMLLGAIKDG